MTLATTEQLSNINSSLIFLAKQIEKQNKLLQQIVNELKSPDTKH